MSVPSASWAYDFEKYAHMGVIAARRHGSNFIAESLPIPKAASGFAIASKYAPFSMTTRAELNDLLELVVIGATGRSELERLATFLSCEIPTGHGCSAPGEPDVTRCLFRFPNDHERHAVEAEFRRCGRDTNQPTPLPGCVAVSVRSRGLVPLSSAQPELTLPPLLEFLKRYGQEMQRVTNERAIAEQASASALLRVVKPHARKLKYNVRFMHNGALLELLEGFVVTEAELLAAIAAIDADALIPLDGKAGLKALRPGELRFRTKFFQTVPTLGLIDVQQNHIVGGVDETYVSALRHAGADIEVFGDETAPIPTSRAKRIVPA